MKLTKAAAICAMSFSVIFTPLAGSAKSVIDLSGGYRTDRASFNIAGNIEGQNPNILSELTWQNLEIYQVRAAGRTSLNSKTYIEGSAGYGLVASGKNQDSDYAGDNRTQEFSRSNNLSNGNNVFDLSLAYGRYITENQPDKTKTSLLLGYSVHQQNWALTNGYQTIPPSGAFSGLNSTYKSFWYGPWVGVKVEQSPSPKFNLFAQIEYHHADFYAEADWNLRSDFAHPKSFEHVARGKGTIVSLGTDYRLDQRWTVNSSLSFSYFTAKNGVDNTFFANGSAASTRLNESKWDSWAVEVKATRVF